VINLANNQIGFLLSIFAALSTMIGWLIVVVKKRLSKFVVAISLLMAAFTMILISLIELLPTANKVGLAVGATLFWLAVGVFVVVFLRFVSDKLEIAGNRLKKSAILVATALILHNFPEGSVAISTTIVDFNSGLVAAVAISLHNIPEGLAIAVTAVASGMGARKVFALVAASAIAEMLGAVVVLVGSQALSEILVAKLLTVVAGIMFTVAITELIPHGLSSLKSGRGKGN
jgi:ZIP family zinc transporter